MNSKRTRDTENCNKHFVTALSSNSIRQISLHKYNTIYIFVEVVSKILFPYDIIPPNIPLPTQIKNVVIISLGSAPNCLWAIIDITNKIK